MPTDEAIEIRTLVIHINGEIQKDASVRVEDKTQFNERSTRLLSIMDEVKTVYHDLRETRQEIIEHLKETAEEAKKRCKEECDENKPDQTTGGATGVAKKVGKGFGCALLQAGKALDLVGIKMPEGIVDEDDKERFQKQLEKDKRLVQSLQVKWKEMKKACEDLGVCLEKIGKYTADKYMFCSVDEMDASGEKKGKQKEKKSVMSKLTDVSVAGETFGLTSSATKIISDFIDIWKKKPADVAEEARSKLKTLEEELDRLEYSMQDLGL